MYQKFLFAGRVASIEMRYTPTGQAVVNMSIPVNRTYKSAQGEKMKETMWVRTTAWGSLAETCNQYLKKGSLILVEGRLNVDPATGGPRVYTRQDGTSGASFEVTAEAVRFLSGNGDGEGHDQPAQGSEDDVPF